MAIEKPITEILASIDSGEYAIPEFQRGFVWNADQVKKFMRSLYLEYPTGSLLIWKTQRPSKVKGKAKDHGFTHHHLILDGQQRLTTIYTLFHDKTPEWYEGAALRTDLYFNLETEEFQYYKPSEMSGRREWIHVTDFLKKGGLTPFIENLDHIDSELREYYQKNLLKFSKLEKVRNYGYYIKEISIDDPAKIVEIFNLVNDAGTQLTESDLALAIFTRIWPDIKNEFREAHFEFLKYNYDLDFAFFVRAINVVLLERGLFTSAISSVGKEELEETWKEIKNSLYYIINVLRENAFIDSSKNLSTVYVLYILIYYITKNDGKFKSKEDRNKAIYWLFMAQMWGRYSGSSESTLEKDLRTIQEKNTFESLIRNLRLYRGSNLYLSPSDLEMQGVQSKVFNVFYSAIRAQNAADWTDSSMPLYSKNIGYNNALERHHIFPKDILYKRYDSANTIHRRMVNEISNIALITSKSNKKILNRPPSEYFNEIAPIQLRKQFVPANKDLWSLEFFEAFLSERRKTVAEGINNFLKSYYEYNEKEQIPLDLQSINLDIENIELALRNKIESILQEGTEEDTYLEFVPQHIRGKTDNRIKSFVSKNPGEDKAQFESFKAKLQFFDLQELKDVILKKENWRFLKKHLAAKVFSKTDLTNLPNSAMPSDTLVI